MMEVVLILTGIENKLMVTKGEREGEEGERGFGINRKTLPHYCI